MNTILAFLGIGGASFLIGRFSPVIAEFFRKIGPSVIHWFTALDDRAVSVLPEKWRNLIPAWAHEKWDAAAIAGVSYAEGIVGTKEFWDEALFILKGNRTLIPDRLWTLLSKWAGVGGKVESMPEEAKLLANQVKSVIAGKIMAAHVATLPAELRPTQEEITGIVSALAPAVSKTIIPTNFCNPPAILDRPAEVQAEIEKLRVKNMPILSVADATK